jgi:preprotein translocase subunit YajC
MTLMLWNLFLLLAEGEQQTPQNAPQTPLPFQLILPLGLILIFYFFLLRPMRRQEQERQAIASSIKKGDRILTTSGIYGTVVGIAEKEDEITVKVDNNVNLRMVKASVARNLTNEEAARAAQTPQGTAS